MSSVSDLCTTIISDLNRGDVSISDAILIDVLSSIREYEAQRFFFNEQVMTMTLSATNSYALSLFATAGSVAEIVEVDSIDITVNNGRTYDLDERNPAEILRRQGNGLIGNPAYFCVYNQSLLIDSTPSQALTATMAAHVRFADVTISTSNVWTNVGFELIRNATLKRLWGRKYKDYEAAQAAGVAEQGALVALQRRTGALSGSAQTPYL